jgi:hypothetical protein
VDILKYYKGSFFLTSFCMAFAYGFAGIQGAVLALVLSILEVSVSLDNAVVNAKILQDMNQKWRKRFLTWGMAFSVFFVRILFPILIVWFTSALTLYESFALPFQDANKYATTVQAAHISIAGYGGAFLLMVFLAFFIDQEKRHHWLPGVERLMAKFGGVSTNSTYPALAIAGAILAGITILLPQAVALKFAESAAWGIGTWVAVHLLGVMLEGDGNAVAAKSGLGAFLYLNVLDASFSFDGVIGAFAVSNNIVIISAGLASGAMFVRSMTIHMVDKGTLGTLKFLEHGAFWSIGILAAMMFIGTVVHIPEILTGLAAAAVLAIAVVHSWIHLKRPAPVWPYPTNKEVLLKGSMKDVG